MGFNNAASVTPDDSNDLAKGGVLYIGGAGSGGLKVTTKQGQVVTFAGVGVGWFGDLEVERVWSTGTNVTNIVVAY